MVMKRWLANIICGVIPNKTKRKKFRVKLQFETKWCERFVMDYMGKDNIYSFSTHIGRGGMNYIVIVNRKYVFKFPIRPEANKNPIGEKRISDYFATILSCDVPRLELIEYNGIYIQKYDFLDGVILEDADKNLVNKNIDNIAAQIAEFIFVLSISDPCELRDLKPYKALKPEFLYGWCHNDIGGNFVLNPKTAKLVGFIDWDDACFGDVMRDLIVANNHWNKFGYSQLGMLVMKNYATMYIEYINKRNTGN